MRPARFPLGCVNVLCHLKDLCARTIRVLRGSRNSELPNFHEGLFSSRFQGLDGRWHDGKKRFFKETMVGMVGYKEMQKLSSKKHSEPAWKIYQCINRPTRCTSFYSSEAAGGMLSMEACLPSVFHTDTF